MGVIATFNIAKRMPAATGAAAAGAAPAVDVAVAPTFVLCPLSVLPSFLQGTRRESEVATGTGRGTGAECNVARGDLIFTLVWHLLYAPK